MAECGCMCNCHRDSNLPEWPGPCGGCCEAGNKCACGITLEAYETYGKKMTLVALHNLRYSITELKQPTLGVTGGVNRQQVLGIIDEMVKWYE